MPTADCHLVAPFGAPRSVAATACVILALALSLTGCGSAPISTALPTGTSRATAVPSSSPAAVEPVASIDLAAGAGLLLPGDDGGLYIATETGVFRLDPSTNEATSVIDGLSRPFGFNVGFGSAWISRSTENRGWIARYDLRTGDLVAEIDVGRMPLETLTAFGSVWAPNHHSSSVSRIDPATNSVVATIEVMDGGGDPYGLAADDQTIWTTSPNGGKVSGIDPETNTVVTELDASACGIAAMAGRVWAASCESPLTIAFPSTGGDEVGRMRAGVPLTDGQRFWTTPVPMAGPVSNGTDPLVIQALDPDTLETGPAVDTGVAEASAWVVALGSLWVTSGDEVHRYSLDDLPT